ncbi:uncharacterized protein LOC108651891 isoform X2 [Drosophila navojoa]|uniref:uncharacterized protein LOC108651891 isoform X2 n=1 Tax=Drosophila navojoa TaxID=7232 RepID=UPI0011BD8763|nr:uncharacterized protein LOC108651891 isoform X2 [Drosophila navojoa]
MSDAGGTNGYQKMPPGWDCKYDQTTGNCYYINYLTKAMQLEDPRAGRSSYKQLQNERCSTESIALQPLAPHSHHSSPFHVVHPSNNLTAVRAFQERALHNLSSSPLLSASSRGQLELSSPLPVQRARLPSNMSRRSTIQETSFSDTQAVVTKIQNMFPTADENHIRLLLKRYYNREAVVISALQVEKHPVTMPGPFVTPPAQRHLFHSNSAFYMTPPARRLDMGASRATVTSRTASPLPGGRFGSLMSMQSGHQPTGAAGPAGVGAGAGVGVGAVGLHGSPQWRSSPKPHSSPKMKLRYMKNIFPKADEMLLLDILANADNNVQFASEKLISLGYVKRDMQQPHRPNNRPPQLESEQQAGQEQAVQYIPLRPKEYTAEQKAEMESQLKLKYPHIAERIILMALESVNYAEDRATQILQIVQDEDEQRNQKQTLSKSQPAASEMKLKVDQVDATSSSKPHKQHRHLPSINVITPSTATTQIILSHEQTPEQVPNEAAFQSEPEPEPASQLKQPQTMSASSISSASTHSYASPPHSPTRPNYERLTTKSMLARSSCYNNNNISSGNNTNNNNSISSYASYSTSMGSSSVSASSIVKAFESRARTKTDSLKQRQHSSQLDNGQHLESGEFQSLIERMATLGANPQLAKGADENLLLADYVTWNGPNTTLCQKQTPQGPDAGLIGGERGYKAVGRNAELCKGPNKELSKGSIYARSKGANIKCN